MKRFFVLLAAACGGGGSSVDAGAPDVTILPDEREPCAASNPLKNPYFGDLHVHTSYSFDAAGFGTRGRPEDAYAFARGEAVGLPPYDMAGQPLRMGQLERPLDFAAVTDHAELLGETQLCRDPASPAYDHELCVEYRSADIVNLDITGLFTIIVSVSPEHAPFCTTIDCLGEARSIWTRIQDAAEDAYDRTAACSFTSFVAYEWSATPLGSNLHRNVIFKNRQAPALPSSYIEAQWAEELWRQLDATCMNAGTGCEALTIPHNSNLSAGTYFAPIGESFQPLTAEEARKRATMEPVAELYQHKGSSECMPGFGDPLASEDELCAFENVQRPLCTGAPTDPPRCAEVCSVGGGIGFNGECADVGDFLRTSMAVGLAEEQRLGVNPFQVGFIGSTDTHLGTPGFVDERGYAGHVGESDDTLAERFGDLTQRFSPGGLAVIWAEENTRDALFDALRRRETYATSGTRPVVRFFGGWSYPGTLCSAADLVEQGYAGGVPMGGNLPAAGAASAPVFVISGARDPGTTQTPGTPFQRAQIVKGWLDGGETRFEVFEVAGDPGNGATVDPATCQPLGAGFDTLCTVWTDPAFDPAAPAFYYARLVEYPTCRWNAWQCLEAGVDCMTLPPGDPLAACCDGSLPATIQERAWTSPIWYSP